MKAVVTSEVTRRSFAFRPPSTTIEMTTIRTSKSTVPKKSAPTMLKSAVVPEAFKSRKTTMKIAQLMMSRPHGASFGSLPAVRVFVEEARVGRTATDISWLPRRPCGG